MSGFRALGIAFLVAVALSSVSDLLKAGLNSLTATAPEAVTARPGANDAKRRFDRQVDELLAMAKAQENTNQAAWCDTVRVSAAKVGATVEESSDPTWLTISGDRIGRVRATCYWLPVSLSVEVPTSSPDPAFYDAFSQLAAGVDRGSADDLREILTACVQAARVKPMEGLRRTFERGELRCAVAPDPDGFVQFDLEIRKARPG